MIPMIGNILAGNAAQMAPKPSPNWGGLLSGPNNPMLMLGLSLLAGNRPSTTPTNPWASAAQGLQASQQMMSEREQREMQKKMYELQMAKYSQPDKPEVREVNGALMERQGDGSWKEVVAKQTTGEPPKVRERFNGTEVIQEEWDAAAMKWREIGKGQRWAPEGRDAPRVNSTNYYGNGGKYFREIVMSNGEVVTEEVNGIPSRMAPYDVGLQGELAGVQAEQKAAGAEAGAAQARLADASASLPKLEQVITDLSALGKRATYTMAGQAVDATKRQLGMEVGPGAIARAEYIAKVDNEVLPLLRETFGAAFTQKEGESLKVTLGDPNKSPEEKDAVLRAFISSKTAQIDTLRRRTSDDMTMMPKGPSVDDRLKKYGF